MTITINKGIDYSKLNTQALHQEALEAMNKYLQLELGYKEGAVSYTSYKYFQTDIYEKSPYEDIWDFLLDYNRYKAGLPIPIYIKLV